MRRLLPAWRVHGLVRAVETGPLANIALEVTGAFAIRPPTPSSATAVNADCVAYTSLLMVMAVSRNGGRREGGQTDDDGDGSKNDAFHGIILLMLSCETSRTDCAKDLARVADETRLSSWRDIMVSQTLLLPLQARRRTAP